MNTKQLNLALLLTVTPDEVAMLRKHRSDERQLSLTFNTDGTFLTNAPSNAWAYHMLIGYRAAQIQGTAS